MNDERRYSEEEIAAIFQQATQAQEAAQRQLAPSEGLTLADLQELGLKPASHPILSPMLRRISRDLFNTFHQARFLDFQYVSLESWCFPAP